MRLTVFCILCTVVAIVSVQCERKTSDGDEKAKLPEFLSELDLESLEASEEDVEALKNVVKRLAPEKNGEYQVYQVFFGNEDLLKEWLKGADVSGQPGVDFPALTTIPATSFSCRGLKGGYYADLETNCQVFHICDNGRKISFLCPNGTIFQQSQLICDWWFKVDCSKSAELYEQSAEQLAEEERRRAEFKKMNSEFHRESEKNGNSPDQNYYANANYNGRQNGRSNPYGQSAVLNQIQDEQQSKSQSNVRGPNQFIQNENLLNARQGSNVNIYDQNQRRGPGTINFQTNFRQQNQLVNDPGEKNNQLNFDRGSGKYSDTGASYQGKSSQDEDYFGSAANVNTRKDEKQTFTSSKAKSFTRNNFNTPVQKVTPTYTETTTFRTSTANPVREFQQLAESASFTAGQGARYNKAYSSNQFNVNYSNNRGSTSNNPQKSTVAPKEKSRTTQSTSGRSGIPAFPGPTFTPIFKPRVVSTTPRVVTTEKPYANTNYYGQNVEERTTYSTPVESVTRTSYTQTQDYQTTNHQRNVEYSSNYYTNDYKVTSTQSPFARTTTSPVTSTPYNAQNYYHESATNRNTAINEETVTQSNTQFNYQNGLTSATDRYNQRYTAAPSTVLTESNSHSTKNYQNYKTQQYSTKVPSRSSGTSRQNLNASTEKSSQSHRAYQNKATTPYDASFTYQQGKVMSTAGPYVPFTKNYAYHSASTTQRAPTYTATVPTWRVNSLNPVLKNKGQATSVPISYSSISTSSSRATYLPKKTTAEITHTTPKSVLDKRPSNEREHALSMLHSLQGLEGTVPTLINARGGNRTGLNIPNSSGPSTLHSLALYFATAGNNNSSSSNESTSSDSEHDGENLSSRKNDASVELPTSILTQHTINSYAELFNLNNALENNATGFDVSDEQSDTDEDVSDLELQQSAGPLNGGKKTNSTKLRELAQVFTQALSAYLQDPETFKRVLTEIRPTEPPPSNESHDGTTLVATTTEDYPSVTKEKDEVLDFSDDISGARRRIPTTVYPEATTREPHYSSPNDYYTTESQYQTSTSSPNQQSTYDESAGNEQQRANDFAYNVNNAFDSIDTNYKSGLAGRETLGNEYESYFPTGSNQVGGFQNNTEPYGKYVKPFDATPIGDNYVASSTPATWEVGQTIVPDDEKSAVVGHVRQDLAPPLYQNLAAGENTVTAGSYSPEVTNGVDSVTPIYRRNQESTTTEPFRIRYYDATGTKQRGESLIPANSQYSNYGSNNNVRGTDGTQTTNSLPADDSKQRGSNHWTSSPTVTRLWESTVFLDPQHINRELVTDPKDSTSTLKPKFSDGIEYNTAFPKDELLVTDASSGATLPNFFPDQSTPWQWASNNDDSPTAFTLLPAAYSTENTATPTPTYTTRSSITTTITSSVTSSNSRPQEDLRTLSLPQNYNVVNVTENEIIKAKEMFGNLNESSSNTLMKVMQQADNNVTVRQLVLLLINHCNGPMNKTMEEEKEQLLNALLRLPVNEFSSEESKEIIAGISRIHLPIGRSRFGSKSDTNSRSISSTEPTVTTYRSRKGRRYKSTTERSPNARTRSVGEAVSAESRNAVLIEGANVSDSRALELLRSLYSIAAKWG